MKTLPGLWALWVVCGLYVGYTIINLTVGEWLRRRRTARSFDAYVAMLFPEGFKLDPSVDYLRWVQIDQTLGAVEVDGFCVGDAPRRAFNHDTDRGGVVKAPRAKESPSGLGDAGCRVLGDRHPCLETRNVNTSTRYWRYRVAHRWCAFAVSAGMRSCPGLRPHHSSVTYCGHRPRGWSHRPTPRPSG